MFTIDPQITDLLVKEKNIYKVLFSMNIHQVATPEMMLEDARSYVCFFRENKGTLSAYIAIHLLMTNRSLYYSYSDNPFPYKNLDAVEEEAVAFAEILGAMLDEIDFTKITDSEKKRWIEEQEIFSQKQSPETRSVPQPDTHKKPVVSEPQVERRTLPVQPTARVIQEPHELQLTKQDQLTTPVTQQDAAAVQQESQALTAQSSKDRLQETIEITSKQPVQTVSTPETVSHVPPASKGQKSATDYKAESSQLADEVAHEGQKTMPQEQPPPMQRSKMQNQQSTPTQQQEILQETIKANIAKPPKKAQSRESQPITNVVRRDREAFARLLSSF